jgi:uncharacterized protein YbaR (Trm112 family)
MALAGSHLNLATLKALTVVFLQSPVPKGNLIMDLVFNCPNCEQELAVDPSGAGSEIECPSCGNMLLVPDAIPQNLRSLNPMAASAAAREEKHFSVPVHSAPSESLIQKPLTPLDVAAVRDSEHKLRIKSIRRTDCAEVGKDRFDEVVTDFLQKIGEANIVSINTITYTHLDIGSQKLLTDYGVLIVYKG